MSSGFMRGHDLRGTDLAGADLRKVNLRGADVGGADLCGASLREALLSAMAWTESTALPGRYLDRIRSSSRQVAADRFLIANGVAAASRIRLDDRPINEPQ
ncbi:pentapeptide repeat-containing protein [Nonomuraea sp. NPDC049400]|uniref:pentapeptide repeat-containing protein n=1 Tax=Nonomuraea sp. NPDC049400 TaxID=3364352 RepID=UPI0037BD9B56